MSDQPEKTPDQLRIEKMDAVTDGLLALILLPTTTEQQKGKLFERVMQWAKDRPKSDLDDHAEKVRIDNMDRVADHLLDLVGAEKTSEVQKGRLLDNVLAWYKVREKLIPAEDGGKLRSMSDDLKSTSSKRSGDPKRGRDTSGDGRAIRKLIGALPPYGRSAGGNQARTEFKGDGDAGDARSAGPNGSGDDTADDDGAAGGIVI